MNSLLEAPVKKCHFTALSIALLALLATPCRAPAKAATFKIIISGPDLPSPLEITDDKILNLSGVWSRGFLDNSHGHPEERPERILPYELSFYVKLSEDDVRLMYVAYYYPEPSTKRGQIYLPGRREPWYYLNTSSIIREGEDGKWNYASPAWE
ncbi:MAG TPA: hypothetical protein VG051_02925, partial [Candidatus Acidoferrum sp.]|nr:hypothetical protein [Candidatus Acidoferrum sp.]